MTAQSPMKAAAFASLSLVLVLAPLSATKTAMAAPSRGVLLTETRKVSLPEPFDRVNLIEDLRRDLEGKGCPVIDSCSGPSCAVAVTAGRGVTDVIAIDATYA